MHVPQARQQVLAGGIDHAAGRRLASRRPHPYNARALDNHRLVGPNDAGRHVYHVGVHKANLLGLGRYGAAPSHQQGFNEAHIAS
ncbi:hypothetical protein [Hymenobacter sp. BRD128]|uniref:hypothetical protein n=1 Tax=Hymenobacter sp. BRD128 TaxID=2675878 RepID=UPI001C25C7D1|nr:hypothetical protein [Hymenobacter sp. BRD128]